MHHLISSGLRGINRGSYQSKISQFNSRTRGGSFSYVQLHGFVWEAGTNNPANLIMFPDSDLGIHGFMYLWWSLVNPITHIHIHIYIYIYTCTYTCVINVVCVCVCGVVSLHDYNYTYMSCIIIILDILDMWSHYNLCALSDGNHSKPLWPKSHLQYPLTRWCQVCGHRVFQRPLQGQHAPRKVVSSWWFQPIQTMFINTKYNI